MKKQPLGKGLGALMGEINEVSINETPPAASGVSEVDITLIDRDENQPRKDFDEEKLQELANSLKIHGVMQPLLVVARSGRYTIVAGERRYRAARIAGLKQLPVIVKELTDQEILEISLIENIQREDLNAIEQSEALIMLMKKYKLTQEEAAERVGKSRPAIANLVRLSQLPSSIKKKVLEGTITAGHARAVLGLKTEVRMKEAARIIEQKSLSVRQTEEMVRDMLTKKEVKPPQKFSPEWFDAQKKLSAILDTKVKFAGSEDKGKITIEYYSKKQMLDLYDKLSR